MASNRSTISMKLIAEFADGRQADIGTVEVLTVVGETDMLDAARRAVEHGLSPSTVAPGIERCPRCDSPDPRKHPAVQFEGEVSICSDPWHQPTPPWMADRSAADSDMDPLQEARSWARHGYEIGQRSATWADDGVAPKWLTDWHDPASLNEIEAEEADRG